LTEVTLKLPNLREMDPTLLLMAAHRIGETSNLLFSLAP
jgi:hypothetical protein